MSEVAAIGALTQVGGFALAGARIYPADTVEQARAAWGALPDAVAVVILTCSAAEALGTDQAAPQRRLTVVMPP
jgi:hypothetical protein